MQEKNNDIQDVDALRYIQQKQGQINKFFQQMRFKAKDFENQSNLNNQNAILNPQSSQTKPIKQNPKYSTNYRGQKVYSIDQLRTKYQNAFFFTKWLTLPYCRRTIFGKIQFWLGASFIFTYMWGSYYMRKNNLQKLHWIKYRNVYGLFALGFTSYVFIQSMLFQPYCDINSYHYKQNDSLFIAKDIKKELKELTK